MPSSDSSAHSRPCKVSNILSLRPRASGEYPGKRPLQGTGCLSSSRQAVVKRNPTSGKSPSPARLKQLNHPSSEPSAFCLCLKKKSSRYGEQKRTILGDERRQIIASVTRPRDPAWAGDKRKNYGAGPMLYGRPVIKTSLTPGGCQQLSMRKNSTSACRFRAVI